MPPQRQQRIAHLDGMRGVAILVVLGVHWLSPSVPGFGGGYIGVDLFFVLSGFVITTLLIRRSPGYWRFTRDRVRRLYPPLLGLLIGGTLLTVVWPGTFLDPAETFRRALVALVQLSSPWEAFKITPLVPFTVTWSLAVEWYFYLLWPVVAMRLARLGWRRAAAWSLALGAACIVVALPLPPIWFYYGPVSHFGALLVGGAVAFWLNGRDSTAEIRLPRFAPAAALVFVAAWTLLGPEPYGWTYKLVGAPLGALAAVVLIVAGDPRVTRTRALAVLSSRFLVRTGYASYSLYLWHPLPFALIPPGWLGWPSEAVLVVRLVMVAVLTYLSFRLLEQPHRNRSARPDRERRPEADPVA